MIATHSIKHDGVWYKVGDEVPESNSNSAPSDFMYPPETPYTKTEINIFFKSLPFISVAFSIPFSLASFFRSAVDILLIEKFGL